MDAFGMLLTIAAVVYWCYAFRLLLDKEPSIKFKVFFLFILFAFPLITPAIIYIFYLDFFKKRQMRKANI